MDNDCATFWIGEGIGPAVAFLSPPLPALPPRGGLPRSKPPGKSGTLWAASSKTRPRLSDGAARAHHVLFRHVRGKDEAALTKVLATISF
jgi:hypothetical protein